MNKVAQFLTSFEALISGMLIFVVYRYVEVQSLFYRYLPLQDDIKRLASLLVAVVVVLSLLLFSAHLDRFKVHQHDSGRWIKNTLFCFTLFINFFFWKAWSDDGASTQLDQILTIGFKVIIVIFFAAFDYAFNHIFISIFNEQSSKAKLQQDSAQLEAALSELQLSVRNQRAKLSDLLAREDPKVCPRCLRTFESSNHRNGHLRTCQKTINLN